MDARTLGNGSESTREKAGGRSRRGLRVLALGLLAAAAVKELRKPPEARTWNGTLFRFLPYDLRPPTISRIKESLWAPDDDRFLLPRAFGIGFSPNFARLARVVRRG